MNPRLRAPFGLEPFDLELMAERQKTMLQGAETLSKSTITSYLYPSKAQKSTNYISLRHDSNSLNNSIKVVRIHE